MSHNNTKYYIGYIVEETDNGKFWTRVATAWPHRNGKEGFSIELRALPLSGRVVFFPPENKEAKETPDTKKAAYRRK